MKLFAENTIIMFTNKPQINNAGLMSNKNMNEKIEYIEKMVNVNVTGTILVRIYDELKQCYLEILYIVFGSF